MKSLVVVTRSKSIWLSVSFLCCMILFAGAAFPENAKLESDPDPAYVTIEPWDTNEAAFVTPGDLNQTDQILVTVLNNLGIPMDHAQVVIDLSGCPNLCIDPIWDGLSGYTSADGTVFLNPRVGGCEECTVIVRVNGITCGTYQIIRSTDFNGTEGDGVVNAADLSFFAAAFNYTQFDCADYDNSGWVGVIDLMMFVQSFLGMTPEHIPDSNPGGCR